MLKSVIHVFLLYPSPMMIYARQVEVFSILALPSICFNYDFKKKFWASKWLCTCPLVTSPL